MKLLAVAALVVFAYFLVTGRWPWQKRLTARERALAKARGVLGVDARADRGTILSAHRRRLAEVHPDRGGSGAGVHEANAARDLLLADLPPATIPHPKEPS